MNVQDGPGGPPQHDADDHPSEAIGRPEWAEPPAWLDEWSRQERAADAQLRRLTPLYRRRRRELMARGVDLAAATYSVRNGKLIVVSPGSGSGTAPNGRAREHRRQSSTKRGPPSADDPDLDGARSPAAMRAIAADAGLHHIGSLVEVELKRLARLPS